MRTPNRRKKTTSGLVEGAFEPSSSEATIVGSTGSASYPATKIPTGIRTTGGRTRMGSKALRRGDCEPSARKEAVPRNGGGA